MDLQIFPNPVISEFRISLNVDRGSQLEIEMLNLLSQTTYRADLNLVHGQQTLYFSEDMVSQAMPQSGIYMLNIRVDGNLIGTRKIVKQ